MGKDRFEQQGLGVTARELQPGSVVMVAVGGISAKVNGGPCTIAWAVVRGPASDRDASVFVNPDDVWWLDVYTIPAGPPLPQMYAAGDILGVPALGMSMVGAPAAHPDITIADPTPAPSSERRPDPEGNPDAGN